MQDMLAAHRSPLRLVGGREEEHPEDPELVDALAAGETWAVTATWNKHSPMVFRFLHRALGSAADVEDLTQEVFVVLFSRVCATSGIGTRSVASSLSVAVRMLKAELRRRRMRRIFLLSSMADLPEHPVPALDAEARQALRRFYAILDRLGAEERAAFALRHLEGLKLEEVARALRDVLGHGQATPPERRGDRVAMRRGPTRRWRSYARGNEGAGDQDG